MKTKMTSRHASRKSVSSVAGNLPKVPVHIDFNAVCAGVDWKALQAQKKVLYALQGPDRQGMGRTSEKESNLLEGLINFIETLQDVAENQDVWSRTGGKRAS
jgi:hypothetical protein